MWLQQMEPDPLLERLDTVLGEDSEQLGFVPTELPPALEDILEALQKQPGVEGITLGRQVIKPSRGHFLLTDPGKKNQLQRTEQNLRRGQLRPTDLSRSVESCLDVSSHTKNPQW